MQGYKVWNKNNQGVQSFWSTSSLALPYTHSFQHCSFLVQQLEGTGTSGQKAQIKPFLIKNIDVTLFHWQCCLCYGLLWQCGVGMGAVWHGHSLVSTRTHKKMTRPNQQGWQDTTQEEGCSTFYGSAVYKYNHPKIDIKILPKYCPIPLKNQSCLGRFWAIFDWYLIPQYLGNPTIQNIDQILTPIWPTGWIWRRFAAFSKASKLLPWWINRSSPKHYHQTTNNCLLWGWGWGVSFLSEMLMKMLFKMDGRGWRGMENNKPRLYEEVCIRCLCLQTENCPTYTINKTKNKRNVHTSKSKNPPTSPTYMVTVLLCEITANCYKLAAKNEMRLWGIVWESHVFSPVPVFNKTTLISCAFVHEHFC